MNNFKPKVSSESRIHQVESRYARRKQQGNEPKGKKAIGKDIGKLTEILNMPLDVFFEVTSHLKPIDILQLSRSSKQLRSMLLSRGSRSIWLAARRNISPPMPECPEHMNEAQYAHLVFERTCDACGVNQSVNVDYAIPARLCGPCWKANTRNGGRLAREAGLKKAEQTMIFNLLPSACVAAYQWNLGRVTGLKQSSKMTYYEPEFVAVAERYKELLSGKDEKALQQFIDDRKADTIRRVNFNLAVVDWYGSLQGQKQQAQEIIQRERITAIKDKLRELGYDPSEFPPHDYSFLQMLNQPRQLTTRIWNTIRPKLTMILDAERERRAEAALKAKWSKRRAQFKEHYELFLRTDREQDKRKRTLPGFEDMISLCHDVLTGAEPDVDVTPGECAAIEERVFAQADEYLATARRDLVSLMRECTKAGVLCITPKPKGRKGKGKGKGKGKAVESDSDSDEELDEKAEVALLEANTAFFSCQFSLSRDAECFPIKSYLGHIEHWQRCHSSLRWSTEHTYHFTTDQAKPLVDALGLPKGATMSEIEDAFRGGRQGCSCGFNAAGSDADSPVYVRLCKLIRHFTEPPYEAQNVTHKIHPAPVSAQAQSQEGATEM